MIEAEDLSLWLPNQGRPVFERQSTCLRAGNILGVTGRSGSGKTAFLMALGGHLEKWIPGARLEGRLEVLDHEQLGSTEIESVAVVVENPYSQLTGLKSTVLQELAVPLEMQGVDRRDILCQCMNAAEEVGLEDKVARQLRYLSGGELVRLHLASALVGAPKLMLFDQVFSELDRGYQADAVKLISRYSSRSGAVAVMSFSSEEISCEGFAEVMHLSADWSLGGRGGSIPFLPTISRPAASGRSSLLKVRDLGLTFDGEKEPLFSKLTFDLGPGEVLLLQGKNGSGKSTLLRILSGALQSSEGEITIKCPSDGRSRGDAAQTPVSLGFQNPDLAFFRRTMEEEAKTLPRSGSRELFAEMVDIMGLNDFLAFNTLDLPRSVRKRFSVALAAAVGESVVLLDEPTQYQDQDGLEGIVETVDLLVRKGVAILCTSHDKRFTERLLQAGCGTLDLDAL